MEEVDYQSKNFLIGMYVLDSILALLSLYLIILSAWAFDISQIANQQIALGVFLGFIAFIFVMFGIFMRSVTDLIDEGEALSRGEYK